MKKIAFIYLQKKLCEISEKTVASIVNADYNLIGSHEFLEHEHSNPVIKEQSLCEFTLDTVNDLYEQGVTHMHRVEETESLVKPLSVLNDFIEGHPEKNFISKKSENLTEYEFCYDDLFLPESYYNEWTLNLDVIRDIISEPKENLNKIKIPFQSAALSYSFPFYNGQAIPLFKSHFLKITLNEHFSYRGSHVFEPTYKKNKHPIKLAKLIREKAENNYSLYQQYKLEKTTPWTESCISFGSGKNPHVLFLLHDKYQSIEDIANLFRAKHDVTYCGRPFHSQPVPYHNQYLQSLGLMNSIMPSSFREINHDSWDTIKKINPKTALYIFSYVPEEDWITQKEINKLFDRSSVLLLCSEHSSPLRGSFLKRKLEYEDVTAFQSSEKVTYQKLLEHINSYLGLIEIS